MQNRKFGTNPAYHSVSFSAKSGSFLNSTTVNDCLRVPTPACSSLMQDSLKVRNQLFLTTAGIACSRARLCEGQKAWVLEPNATTKKQCVAARKKKKQVVYCTAMSCDAMGQQHSPNKGSVEFLKLPTRTLSRASFRGALFFSAP